jgi:hypothetical protein
VAAVVGGNVGIAPLLRDFQGTVESAGKPLLLFRAFQGPVISTSVSHHRRQQQREPTFAPSVGFAAVRRLVQILLGLLHPVARDIQF